MVICLSPLIQILCGISSWLLAEKSVRYDQQKDVELGVKPQRNKHPQLGLIPVK